MTYSERRRQQLDFLLKNMSYPDLNVYSFKTLVDAKDISNTINISGISFRIINSMTHSNKAHSELPSYSQIANFMASIQDYLPVTIAERKDVHKLWPICYAEENVSKAERVLVEDFKQWLYRMRARIEDYVTADFFKSGKYQHLEILKRRYKENWSERTEQQIDATVDDKTIEVKFEEL